MTIEELDLSNKFGVSMRASNPELFTVQAPLRQITAEEALVLAAWLLLMAGPFSQVEFRDIVQKVH